MIQVWPQTINDQVARSAIGAAYVRGLQTDDLRGGVVATGKHFLGYAMSEGGRNWGPAQLGPRELRGFAIEIPISPLPWRRAATPEPPPSRAGASS